MLDDAALSARNATLTHLAVLLREQQAMGGGPCVDRDAQLHGRGLAGDAVMTLDETAEPLGQRFSDSVPHGGP